MRVSNEEKERSRRRILDSASRLMRERGVEGTSVADVMGDAGMTHGGFYKHFQSKDELVGAALHEAFNQFAGPLAELIAAGAGKAAIDAYTARYLGGDHVAHPELGCPAAALGPDIGRGTEAAKAAFGDGVNRIVDLLAEAGTGPARRKRAIRQFAMLLGAVVMARASDPATAETILDACRGQ